MHLWMEQMLHDPAKLCNIFLNLAIISTAFMLGATNVVGSYGRPSNATLPLQE